MTHAASDACRSALCSLLLSLFSIDELKVLLRRVGGDGLLHALIFPAAPASYFDDAVTALAARGLIADPLFTSILALRPTRGAEVRRVAEGCGCRCGDQVPSPAVTGAGGERGGVETRPEPDGPFGATLEKIVEKARRTRRALEPVTLPRVPREVTRTHYIPALREALAGRRAPILVILGPAGSGKTTILGEMYDEMADAALSVPVAIRGNDLGLDHVATLGALEAAISELAATEGMSLGQVARRLRWDGRRCVVIVDTLDIVLDERSVGPWMAWLEKLVESGAVVVIGCRDHEFREYVEMDAESFRPVLKQLHVHDVPPFLDAEVLSAAIGFYRARHLYAGESAAMAFAQSLLGLSADRRSLAQIIHSPLLLSMLCTVYGERETVPPDLTVSELYARYWSSKISHTRRPGQRELARAKEELCERLAASCFDPEVGLIRDSADVAMYSGLRRGEEAAHELRSENVLIETLAGRIQYFHQTFLEYAIARWLTRAEADALRGRLLAHLGEPAAEPSVHVWFVLRQFLAICGHVDYEAFRRVINLRSFPAFRTVAQATVARRDEHAPRDLEALIELAASLGGVFAGFLAEVVDFSPGNEENLWRLAVQMMPDPDNSTAVRGMKLAGRLIGSGLVPAGRLVQALGLASLPQLESIMSGFLLEALGEAVTLPLSPGLPAVLRVCYPRLSTGGKRVAVRVHVAHASVAECEVLLDSMLSLEASELADEGEVTELLVRIHESEERGALWENPPEALRSACEADRWRWREILSRGVGRLAVASPAQIDALLGQLRRGAGVASGPDPFKALREVIDHGGSALLLRRLASEPGLRGDLDAMRRLSGIFAVMAVRDDTDADVLVNLLTEVFVQAPNEFVKTVAEMATRCEQGWALICAHFSLLKPDRQRVVVQLLDGAPLAFRAALAGRFGSGSPTRIQLECELAHAIVGEQRDGEDRVVEAIVGRAVARDRGAALEASLLLRRFAGLFLSFPGERLLALARATYPGVREHCIEAFTARILSRGDVARPDFCALVVVFHEERAPNVLRRLGLLITEWIRREREIPAPAATCVFHHVLLGARAPEGDQAGLRELVRALKNIAQACPPLSREGVDAAEALARSPLVERIDDGEALTTQLIARASDADAGLFPRLFADIHSMPRSNATAVLHAQASRTGWFSPNINTLLKRPGLPEWMRARIVKGQAGD